MIRLFVDDERRAPVGWNIARSAEAAINFLESTPEQVDVISLDHDLGYTTDTIMPVLFWMRDNYWPREVYVHTANEDGEEVMLGFIREWASHGTLRGWGCNFWGTGPDSQIQNWADGGDL